jgi:hypothetical protein
MQAAELLADPEDVKQSQAALRLAVLYEGNALEIATGPVPDLNLLDMLVFVTLVRAAFEQHLQPERFGIRGEAMREALAASEEDVWELAHKFLTPDHRAQLEELIRTWQAMHPSQFRVESVRLSDFSELAARTCRQQNGQGLFGSMRVATQAADQALLLGERALFWAQRAPALIRLQVRLGALEITADGLRQLQHGERVLEHGHELLRQVRGLEPLLARTTEATRDLARLSQEGRALIAAAQGLSAPLLAPRPQSEGPALTALETLAHTCAEVSGNLQDAAHAVFTPERNHPAQYLTTAERLVRRAMVYAALVGLSWAVVFWLGYYLVHR